jgi:hypothetical protein
VRGPTGAPLNNALVHGVATWNGRKPTLEDRWCREELPGMGAYFGLFDGHGGSQVVRSQSGLFWNPLLLLG